MIDIEGIINKAFDVIIQRCDFSKFSDEDQLKYEWQKRFKELYFQEAGNQIKKEDFVLINFEYPFSKKGRQRIDVIIEKCDDEKYAIEFKFLPMKGGTGKNRAIPRYVTGILKDIFDLDHYMNDQRLGARAAFFFLITENKNLLRKDYSCQYDIENFSRSDRISIAEGEILNLPNGNLILRWEKDENGSILRLGNGPYFYILRVVRKK